ncbi:MAG: SCO family protein [Anaerolineales bacterium]|nr:SCO family protein [Anaerolineales bacterium]MCB9126525.1 SCO family protein [Ardenticatenales bacterium]
MSYKNRGAWLLIVFAALIWLTAKPMQSWADDPPTDETEASGLDNPLPDILESATFDQNLGDTIPLDLQFTDESGNSVRLGDFVGEKPLLLTMNYYTCESLCPIMLDAVARGLKPIPYTIGKEFESVTVSINPNETAADAAEVKRKLVDLYQRDEAAEAWHFLTGSQENIDALAEAIGFNYTWDSQTEQYAHPSGVIFLTPEGVISRYIYGIEFNPRDLRLALVDTTERRVGTPVDQVLLFCYQYDPTVGSYGTIAINTMRTGGVLTILAMVGGIFWMLRSERRKSKKSSTPQASQTPA